MSDVGERPGDEATPLNITDAVQRKAFESWITAPPYEREVQRYPNDETKYAWPGQYMDNTVQLAWEAWCEAVAQACGPLVEEGVREG